MTLVYLGLGSNVGDRLGFLQEAVSALAGARGVKAVSVSSVYSSEPVGNVDQPEFLNAVAAVETTLEPGELLGLIQRIEAIHGRRRDTVWGPRTLDIDILLFGDRVIEEEDLVVPHPRLRERRFALEPLLEIDKDVALPDGTTVDSLLDELDEEAWVRREEDLELRI